MKERLSAISGKSGRHRGSLIVILIAAAVMLAAAGCSLNGTVGDTSSLENNSRLPQDDAKIAPEIVEYDFKSASEKGEIRQLRGVLPGASEGIWYIVTIDGVEYYYASYDDSPERVELYGYAIVSEDYSLANGISVGMTKDEVSEQYPAMAILDTQGNILNDVTGHMGWNDVAYPHSLTGMDPEWEYPDGKDYNWADQFDCIMIADIEQEQDSLPVYMALMIKDDKVAAITFYRPTAG